MSQKLSSIDNRIKDFIRENFDKICISILLIMSLAVRFFFRDFVSIDANDYLLPWYDEIVNKGRIGALGDQIGNYNMTYQLLIVCLTYIPIKPLYAYKILSCVFDYILGYAVGKVVFKLTGSERKRWISFFFVVFSPIVIINSACWGQCDSIYVSFCILTIDALLDDKDYLPFIWFGVALAFKLQAIFLLPFLLIVWWRSHKYTIAHFFIIPISMVIICLPNILIGHRNVKEIVGIYMGQAEKYERIAMNYPSFWNILVSQAEGELFHILKKVAIFATAVILIAIVIYVEKRQIKLQTENMLYVAMIAVYSCVLFLPAMHERYSFMYEVIALIILMINKRSLKVLIPMYLMTLLDYSNFLFGHEILGQYNFAFAVINLSIYLGYAKLFITNVNGACKYD
ncbi:glycosyltransferase 87 family protein [Butyrivibrio fibrisolvens]|uniref:glycosyltransferase 87 family protein n=1 Tax=Butyrivibrio fibrisolvens TaxID=831 RepID=UPI0003F71DD3|nr:glycosyltransferase 87 family protein [Butyrivibrio fibrisolvens]